VIIRTLLYNAQKKYLSYGAGSALTARADAEKEYEECLLKVAMINQIFKN
jgi:para-aminobenzoate synthetase component 1